MAQIAQRDVRGFITFDQFKERYPGATLDLYFEATKKYMRDTEHQIANKLLTQRNVIHSPEASIAVEEMHMAMRQLDPYSLPIVTVQAIESALQKFVNAFDELDSLNYGCGKSKLSNRPKQYRRIHNKLIFK